MMKLVLLFFLVALAGCGQEPVGKTEIDISGGSGRGVSSLFRMAVNSSLKGVHGISSGKLHEYLRKSETTAGERAFIENELEMRAKGKEGKRFLSYDDLD